MKLNVVAYLIKEGFTESDAIDESKAPQKLDLNIRDTECSLFLKESFSRPKWSEIFARVSEIDNRLFDSKSVQGLLLVNVLDRLIAFTFGHARSLIIPSAIERGFGLKVTLNLGNSEQIKSIDKSTLEKVSLNTRSQTSKNTNVNDFDFEFDQEILKSICAVVENEDSDELETVSGSDSVSIYTQIELDEIPNLAMRLISAYQSDRYQEKYPWVDFIQAVSDPLLLAELNNELIELINNDRLDDVWISPPEIVDYNDFSGFVYKQRKGQELCFHQELDLSVYLAEAKVKQPIESIELLKRRAILIFNGSEQQINSWSIFSCLNSEIVLHDETFILNDGKWYRVDREFSDSVNSFFSALEFSDIEFPPYQNMKEGEYLREIADGENFALLDQKWVYPAGTGNGYRIEFCDLLSQCDSFIHVKRYGSSSVLSHLFAQATVATEFLMNDQTIQQQVNDHLEDTYLSVNFDNNQIPRRYRIILAIMQKTPGELHLPFFSKVNLRHHARRLQNMGFTVELAKITLT